MTEMQLYLAMLDRAGFKYEVFDYSPSLGERYYGQILQQVSVKQTEYGFGYNGFTADHWFDQGGQLVAVGGYE